MKFETIEVPEVPTPPIHTIVEEGRRRQRKRLWGAGASLAAVAVLVATLAVAGRSVTEQVEVASDAPSGSSTTDSPAPQTSVRQDETTTTPTSDSTVTTPITNSEGTPLATSPNGTFATVLPPGWYQLHGNSYMNVGMGLLEQLTVSNEDLPVLPSPNCEIPVMLFDQLSSTGGAVAIRPLTSASSINPKPDGAAAVPTQVAGAYGQCQAQQTDIYLASFNFRDQGQQHILYTALGLNASEATRADMAAIVDSLVIDVG